VTTVQAMLLPQKVLIVADGNKESVLYKHLKILSEIQDSGKGRLRERFCCARKRSCAKSRCRFELTIRFNRKLIGENLKVVWAKFSTLS
jgi:hypothetical protein